MPRKRRDVLGHRFGKLVVTGDADYKGKSRQVTVKCDCGEGRTVAVSNLIAGTTTSCGCYWFTKVSTHGLSQHRLYKTWHGMQERCNNPKHEAFDRYGAAGITVCSEWQSVDAFIAWALVSGFTEGLTLDRINNDLGYSPDNCRWATKVTQGRNKRANTGKTSKYIGVNLHKRTQRWKAHIRVNGKGVYLGYYSTELEAAKARDQYIVDNQLNDFTMNGVL